MLTEHTPARNIAAHAQEARADDQIGLLRFDRGDQECNLGGVVLAIGVVTGYLGAAPSLLWALSALTVVLAPLLIPLSVWLYTLVFAFAEAMSFRIASRRGMYCVSILAIAWS